MMECYSPFFQTLHDERIPAGYLGNGTHVSILRAIIFHHPTIGCSLERGVPADFAVIWDADHDTRVIKAIEDIYREGLLSRFLMFGERKGTLHAIAHGSTSSYGAAEELSYWEGRVHEIAKRMEGDPWSGSVRYLNDPDHKIIDDEQTKISLYLNNLKMLWRLGARVSLADHLRIKEPHTFRKNKSIEYYRAKKTIIAIKKKMPGTPEYLDQAEFDTVWNAGYEIMLKHEREQDGAVGWPGLDE